MSEQHTHSHHHHHGGIDDYMKAVRNTEKHFRTNKMSSNKHLTLR